MSSSKNTCQAVLKPDGSKNMTNKSAGVKKALMNLIKRCLQSDTATNQKLDSSNNELNNLILTDFTTLPLAIQQSGVISIVEFAGTKFKVFATSGQQYLNYISNGIVKKLLNYLPSLERIIICEEKYAFTPNDFKANTRQKRKKKEKVTISHLKEDQEIVSSENFSKQAVVGTMAGKILISRYLATQMQHLKIKADLEINVDSEAYTSKCNCQKEHDESCSRYTVPVRVMYNKQTGYVKEGFIDEVKQRKGEAENGPGRLIELGSETFIQDQKSLITIEEKYTQGETERMPTVGQQKSRATKRRLLDTPQKGKSGKRVQTQSTPSNRGSAYLSMGHIPSAIKNVNQEG
ncbi:unnamed protein product [Mytilus coruscus]|uniref:Uncharacterized protein n=1 Tax=Mytilus coruscus TaxID=42192 RepID=A0A6J8DQF4_MYTCO|nr:unnamed protein product [Mytilus coruscus]